MKKTMNHIVSAFAAFADLYSSGTRVARPAETLRVANKKSK